MSNLHHTGLVAEPAHSWSDSPLQSMMAIAPGPDGTADRPQQNGHSPSHSPGHPTGPPQGGSTIGSTRPGRPILKMKRTGKTGQLLPGLSTPPTKRPDVTSPTRSLGGRGPSSSSAAPTPTTTTLQPWSHSQVNTAPDRVPAASDGAPPGLIAAPVERPGTSIPMPAKASGVSTPKYPTSQWKPPRLSTEMIQGLEMKKAMASKSPVSETPTKAGITKSSYSEPRNSATPSQRDFRGTPGDDLVSAEYALQRTVRTTSSANMASPRDIPPKGTRDHPTPIHKAPSGRPYVLCYDETGRLVSGHGTLFPDGYKLDSSVRDNFWICPIRSCRRLRVYMKGLGKHFKSKHASCLLNDDENGTFSIVGRHLGKQGAMVVSRGPPKPSQRKMATPQLTAKRVGTLVPQSTNKGGDGAEAQSTTQTKASHALQESEDTSESDVEMLEAGHVSPGLGFNSNTPVVPDEKVPGDEAPGVKSPDDEQMRNVEHESQPEHIKPSATRGDQAVSELQTNGDDGMVNIDPNGYERTISGRPYMMFPNDFGNLEATGSVLFPDGYRRWAVPGFEWICPIRSCGSTHHNRPGLGIHFGRKHRGLLLNDNLDGTLSEIEPKGWMRSLVAANAPSRVVSRQPGPLSSESPSGRQPPGRAKGPAGRIQAPELDVHNLDATHDDRRRRSERVLLQEVLARSEIPTGGAEPSLGQEADTPPPSVKIPYKQPQPLIAAPNGLAPSRPAQGTDHLEMEEWEVAPGRLRTSAVNGTTQVPAATEQPENVAFSKACLANQTVRVSADVTFRVEVISSGSSTRWEGNSRRMRVCSVATGKMRVRIGGEDEFSIGHHGMFKVAAGKGCVVQNLMYGDAVLHICEFPNDQ